MWRSQGWASETEQDKSCFPAFEKGYHPTTVFCYPFLRTNGVPVTSHEEWLMSLSHQAKISRQGQAWSAWSDLRTLNEPTPALISVLHQGPLLH